MTQLNVSPSVLNDENNSMFVNNITTDSYRKIQAPKENKLSLVPQIPFQEVFLDPKTPAEHTLSELGLEGCPRTELRSQWIRITIVL